MTHTTTQHQQFDTLAQQVCKLCKWQLKDYSAYMEKCGKQYLQYLQPQDPAGIDMLIESKYFWAWWRTNWYQRDAQFIYHMIDAYSDIYIDLYKEMHDPLTLTRNIYPNGIVLSYTYDRMRQMVVDKEMEGGL